MSEERIEKQIFDKIVFREGEYKVKHTEYICVFDSLLRQWGGKQNEKITYLPLSEWRPKIERELTVTLYLRRFAYDSYSLKPVSAVFEQKVQIKANPENKAQYFGLVEGLVFEHDLNLGITQPLSYRDLRFKKIGDEKRLKPKEVQELIKKGIPIFELDAEDKPVIRL